MEAEALAVAAITAFVVAVTLDAITVRKVGGIWFARIGQLRLSFCVARRLPE